MENFRDKLHNVFGKQDEATSSLPSTTTNKKDKRTVGDVFVAAEAQRIYDDEMPRISKPKAPAAHFDDSGTSDNLGVDGSWGSAND